jgi:hypothetical protein
MKTFRSRLIELHACSSSIRWLDEEGICSIEEAWSKCPRGDWLLWLAARIGLDEDRHKTIVKIATEIARQVLKYIPAEEERPRKAIEAAEKWLDGKEKEKENVINAAAAAYSASAYAAHAAASAAANAAAYAAYAAAYAAEIDAANYASAAATSAAAASTAYTYAAEIDAANYASAAATSAAAASTAAAVHAEIVRNNLSCPKLELEGEGEGGKNVRRRQ